MLSDVDTDTPQHLSTDLQCFKFSNYSSLNSNETGFFKGIFKQICCASKTKSQFILPPSHVCIIEGDYVIKT